MSPIALAKEVSQVILWPDSEGPAVRFTFGKFKEVATLGNQRTYVIDTTAENLSSKLIPNGRFSFYLFDKNKALVYHGRIDDNWKEESAVTREELKEAMNNMAACRPIAAKQTPSMGCSIKWRG